MLLSTIHQHVFHAAGVEPAILPKIFNHARSPGAVPSPARAGSMPGFRAIMNGISRRRCGLKMSGRILQAALLLWSCQNN